MPDAAVAVRKAVPVAGCSAAAPDAALAFDADSVEHRPSSSGNYLGLTITVTATSREQLDELYRTLSSHPMVKVVL